MKITEHPVKISETDEMVDFANSVYAQLPKAQNATPICVIDETLYDGLQRIIPRG